MASRSYGQFCALARTLDVVGERWTLLIVRELMLGPRRYGELLDALPGIGTNLLATRLERMQAEGLCLHRGRAYELGDRGRHLQEPVLALTRWGMTPMAPPAAEERMRPDWYAVAMLAAYRPSRRREDEEYEFQVGDAIFHLAICSDRPSAARGPAVDPAFTLRASLPGFLAIATRAAPLSEAEAEGDPAAGARWLDAFALPTPGAEWTPAAA